jgi:hypothetical protein
MTDTATLITQLRILAQLTRAEPMSRGRGSPSEPDDLATIYGATPPTRTRAPPNRRPHRPRRVPDQSSHWSVGWPHWSAARWTAQPLDEALLGDLALEHQLRDRARYVAAVAGTADLPAVHELARDLEAAH